ncbi:hypothetical protein SIO70_22685 [Chitinophaga sancti]|uniref:hypothetical protein n=1 Tax=Chitinophaga sancti TaxID=1004 RepID=UPI002A7556AC|nr:hypothetical protein [Chitinophaga sancti]WPQ61170.1 hypothetical protein SIO70_22685 [Chitinophaga sancti]
MLAPGLYPATATITNPNSTTATITVPVGDSVMAYWTIVNGTCSTVDSIKLVNYVKPADADAGPDQHQCNTTFTMAANAPSVSTASGTWSNQPVLPQRSQVSTAQPRL